MLVLAALAGALTTGATASAATPPPGAAISDSLQYIGRVPNSSHIVEGKFDTVMGRDVLVTTGTYGFRTYDVRDAAHPKALDTYQPPEILGEQGWWQDEDMEIDRKRKLIIGSLDPRHDDVDQTSCPGIGQLGSKNRNPKCKSGFYVISYKNPRKLEQIGGCVEVPAGHTTSCIDDCRYVWTGGPARRDDLAYLGPFEPGARGDGRPIWVTDLRDPAHPHVFKNPIDLKRNDGLTDYSHDVDVDGHGFAWVSGRGGLLGYATKGRWRDPRTDHVREAHPWDPILVAGGGIPGGDDGVAQPETDFIHNATRPVGGDVRAARRPQGQRGADDRGGLHGALRPGRPDRRRGHHELDRRRGRDQLDARAPVPDDRARLVPPGAQRRGLVGADHVVLGALLRASGSTLAAAWYGEGLRVIDASNARNLRQVGYYYVTGTDAETNPSSLSWDTAWRGNLVYLFDMDRGIEVLRLKGGAHGAAKLATVREPRRTGADRLAKVPVSGLTPGSLVCPLFARQ